MIRSYIEEYQKTIRLDKMSRKRPEKLHCRPGYEQRGAACQKARPRKTKVSKNDILGKVAIGAITAGVVGAVGVAATKTVQNKKKTELAPELIQQKIQQATNEYRRTPTWQKAALVGAIAVGTPPAVYMAARARYRAGFKESARIAEEKAKDIETKKIKDREHTIVFGVGGMSYSDESPEVRSGQRIVRAASMAFSQDKGKDFKLVPVNNTGGNVPEGRRVPKNAMERSADVAEIFFNRLKDGRSQAAVDLAANVIAWSDANPDKQIVMMGHSSGGFDVHEAQEILRIARPDLEKRLKSFSFGTVYFGCTDSFGESYTIANTNDIVTNHLPTKDTKTFKDTSQEKPSLNAHNQSPYFLNEDVKKFVSDTIYKDADKYIKKAPSDQPNQGKKQKQTKPPSQKKTDSYILGYTQNIKIRLDKAPSRRFKKLQCRPGYTQRGAACQKITSKTQGKPETQNTKVSASKGGAIKSLLAVAAIAGISGVAVATAIKKDPDFINKVKKKTADFGKMLSSAVPKDLPKSAQKAVQKIKVQIDNKIGKQPSKAQLIGKEIAIEAASKIIGLTAATGAGGATYNLLGNSSPKLAASLVTSLGAGNAARIWSRNELTKRFGDTGLSPKTKLAVGILMDVAVAGTVTSVYKAVTDRSVSKRAEEYKRQKLANSPKNIDID